MSSDTSLSVQFGCGLKAPASWLNFDVSPTLRMSKVQYHDSGDALFDALEGSVTWQHALGMEARA